MDFLTWLRAQLDRVAAVAAVAVGGLAILLGYLGVREQLYPAGQLPYIASGGILGLALIAVGSTLWISADLRDEWRALEDVIGLLGEEMSPSNSADSQPYELRASGAEPAGPTSDGQPPAPAKRRRTPLSPGSLPPADALS